VVDRVAERRDPVVRHVVAVEVVVLQPTHRLAQFVSRLLAVPVRAELADEQVF